MSNYMERLLEEKEELFTRLTKLETFLFSKEFKNLSEENKLLLKKQDKVMTEYLEILIDRIALNTKKEE